jgi:hypothetical protein
MRFVLFRFNNIFNFRLKAPRVPAEPIQQPLTKVSTPVPKTTIESVPRTLNESE